MSTTADDYEPRLLSRPWVTYDGVTSDIEFHPSRAEAEKHAAALIVDSHDDTWFPGVDLTFVALMVCKATEIPITDDSINYELRPVEKLAPGPMADQLLAKVAEFLAAMPDTARDVMADSPFALGCMRALEEWVLAK